MLDKRDPNHTRAPQITSSLAQDVWHGAVGPHSFERWHFDALSDDGREVIVISFYDNYPFSRRYLDGKGAPNKRNSRHPAVTFLYSVDGKTVMEAVNEWDADRFQARTDDVTCSVGDSAFTVEKIKYGSGYLVHVELVTARRRYIEADLEWLSVEADLSDATDALANAADTAWNLVAPRSDVSGRITRSSSNRKIKDVVHFRGTGYHDHFQSRGAFQTSLLSRCWGRVHFSDVTAVFQHISYSSGRADDSSLALIEGGQITALPSKFENFRPDPETRLPSAGFTVDDEINLKIMGVRSIQKGFFEQRVLAKVELETGGERKTSDGLVEFCRPNGMNNPLYRWMSDLKVGRNGAPPIF